MGVLLSSAVAVLIAVAGAASAAAFGPLLLKHLAWIVGIAATALLGITVFDVLPEARELLSWPQLMLGIASGLLLFAIVSRFVHPICPACSGLSISLPTRERIGRAAVLLIAAVSLHCIVDGLAIAVGGRGDAGGGAITWAVFLHKLPEGMALASLLLAAGYPGLRALAITAAVESTTLAGGIVGAWWLHNASKLWVGLVMAHVGGGFIYIAWSTASAYLRRPKISAKIA